MKYTSEYLKKISIYDIYENILSDTIIKIYQKYNFLKNTKTEFKQIVISEIEKTIKLFVENYSKADILNEALNQARVEEGTDLNIPKLLEISKIDNRWALVSEHVEGKTLGELMEENPTKLNEYLNRKELGLLEPDEMEPRVSRQERNIIEQTD